MIVRYKNKIIRYNEKIGNKRIYSENGYIPEMTSNTKPSPFIAGGNYVPPPAMKNPYWYAFTASDSWWQSREEDSNAMISITLDKKIQIWKYKIVCACDYQGSDNFTVPMVFRDEFNNILDSYNIPAYKYYGMSTHEFEFTNISNFSKSFNIVTGRNSPYGGSYYGFKSMIKSIQIYPVL